MALIATVTNPAFLIVVLPLLFLSVIGPRSCLLHAREVALEELEGMIAEKVEAESARAA